MSKSSLVLVAKCPKCSHENPYQAAFCVACGIRLDENVCLKCGTRLPAEAKFCLACGVSLTEKTPAFYSSDDSPGDKTIQVKPLPVESATPESRHRQLMVMFYDLVGLTPLSRQKVAILHATFFAMAFALLAWVYSLERIGWPDPKSMSEWKSLEQGISEWKSLEASIVNLSSHAGENRLSNASFEKGEDGGSVPVSGWSIADFWNDLQAQGWRRRVKGSDTGYGLELGLKNAPAYGYHLGVQQSCGELPAGTRLVALVADINIPRDLQDADARVEAVFYPLENTGQKPVFLPLVRTKATKGWERISSYAVIPPTAGRMGGMVIIHMVALKALTNKSEAAQFDNVVLVPIMH